MKKRIIEVWIPKGGSSRGECCRVGYEGVTKIDLVCRNGDRTDRWLIVSCGDVERRVNERYVFEVVWGVAP